MIEETPPLTPTQQAIDLLRDAAARLERNQDAPFGCDYLTHCRDAGLYERFLEVNGIRL